MAAEHACFDHLVYNGNEGHFPFFLHNNDEDEVSLAFLADAHFAEELQFQEAMEASLITSEKPSSSSPMTTEEIPFPGHKTCQRSFQVKEKAEPSLGFWGSCLKKKEACQLLSNESCVQSCGLNCSKIIELSKEECHEELSINSSLGNYSAKPFTGRGADSPRGQGSTKLTNHKSTDIGCLYSADNDGEWKASKRKFDRWAEKQEGAQNPIPNTLLEGKDGDHNSGMPIYYNPETFLVHGGNGGSKSEPIGSKSASPASNDGQQTLDCGIVSNVDDSSDSTVVNETDEFDSHMSPKSIDDCKKGRLLKIFLIWFEKLTTEEINEPSRLWSCPACQGGSGATKCFRGLQALISHTKTRGSKRARLHQELALLLEDKSSSKVTSEVPESDVLGKWKAIKKENKDHEIVWPPMVIIRNTNLKKDDNNKWVGMTSQQLLDLFSANDAIVKAQQGYNSQGHCGTSILIFESSARGYLEAELVHKHFADQGTGRTAWDHSPVYFLPGGERQLYGYLAVKDDVDFFNQLSRGEPKLEYEMRSYLEMVLYRIRQMNEDNHRLLGLENWVAQQKMHAKGLEKSNGSTRERLKNAMKEIKILRDRINLQEEQHLEEMDLQEQFFKDQLKSALNEEEKGHEYVRT